MLHARFHQDSEVAQKAARLNRHVQLLFWNLVEARLNEIGHPDPRTAAPFALRSAGAIARECVLFGDPGAEISDDLLADRLTDLLRSYLRVT